MAFVTERNFYVRVLEKPPFWCAGGVGSVCGGGGNTAATATTTIKTKLMAVVVER
jgi:hypothetical protein